MTRKLAGAIAVGAFAAGVFVATAPAALGHGPDDQRGHGRAMAEMSADHLAFMANHMAELAPEAMHRVHHAGDAPGPDDAPGAPR